MKINILETHDRLQQFQKSQEQVINEGIEECLKRNPDSLFIQDRCPYVYIFAHPRTDDVSLNKRMLWQPRILKPKAQTNSYLFRATSHSDIVEICWLLPPRETWNQYEKGKVTENEYVIWSIDQFQHNRSALENDHPDDVSEDRAKFILQEMISCKRYDKMMKNTYANDFGGDPTFFTGLSI